MSETYRVPLSSRLDFTKGLAILLIVFFHARQNWFGWQGVHVFIFLSGFLLAYSTHRKGHHRSWREWSLRRMRRILPAYWMTAIAGFTLLILMTGLGWNDPSVSPASASRNVLLDVSLLRNISYRSMMAYPNAALWYIPLIVGCYLVFPWLYRSMFESTHRFWWARALGLAVGIEISYRAGAVFLLDGIPVGYGQGFLPILGTTPSTANSLAAGFPFQLWAPFGWFPSRIGEFALGVAAARALLLKGDGKEWRPGMALAWMALVLWLSGNWLMYAGRWGWAFGDLLIAPGLTVCVVSLAGLLARVSRPLFRLGERLGPWAYYLYLVHLPVMYVFAMTYSLWAGSPVQLTLAVLATIGGIVVAARSLRRFDDSRWASLLVSGTVGRLAGAKA